MLSLNEIKVHYIHALTGGGYGIKEAEDKANTALPQWGDAPKVVAQKIQTIRGTMQDLQQRAGPAAYGMPDEGLLIPVSPEEARTVTPSMIQQGNQMLKNAEIIPLESKVIGGKTYHKFGPGDWRVDE
jgi:hypothetical protein